MAKKTVTVKTKTVEPKTIGCVWELGTPHEGTVDDHFFFLIN